MEFSVRRTLVQVDFPDTDDGRGLAQTFVERFQGAGERGRARLSGKNRNKVRFHRPGRFALEELEEIVRQFGLEELARPRGIRLQFSLALPSGHEPRP